MIKKSILVCLLVLSPITSVVWGATFDVTTFAELETVLATAKSNAENDTINISAGTYTLTGVLDYTLLATPAENYTLTIQSAGGEVILDGINSSQILRIKTLLAGEDTSNADIIIKGITFLNGRIFSNFFTGAGLNVWTQNSDITIEDSKFIDNVSSGFFQDPNGGGAFIAAKGNGIATLTGNTFTGNSADSIGGGLYTIAGTIILTNNVFNNNECSTYGAGAYIYPTSSTTITNNTFSSNDNGTWAGGLGGGLYVQMYSDTTTANIYNNIIWGNTATSENGEDIYLQTDGDNNGVGATVNLYNNDYTDLDYSDADNLTLADNINQDPLFANNLRIQAGSPCIDAGLNAAPSVPADDIDGNARVNPPDIGAHEYVPSADISTLPSPVAFGNVTLNTSSTKTVTFSNMGVLSLAITNIQISGTDAGLFTLDVNGGSNPVGSTSPTIAVGDSGTVTITFSPAAAGSKSASLDIASDDPDEATVNISLSGTGTASSSGGGGGGGGGGGCFIEKTR